MILVVTQKTMYKYKNTLKNKLDFWSFLMLKSLAALSFVNSESKRVFLMYKNKT